MVDFCSPGDFIKNADTERKFDSKLLNLVAFLLCSAIQVVARGMSKGVKKLARAQARVPNLSKFNDISDYLLG